MSVYSIELLTLVVALCLMTAQLLVKDKKLFHILFAVFCGSVAMATAKKMTGDSIGAYQYLIGIGACATCNFFWLLSRSLFRTKHAVSLRHLLFAVGLGLLMAARQGYFFLSETFAFAHPVLTFSNSIALELIVMLSSCVLLLSFWEGYRGLAKAKGKEKISRVWFLAVYAGAVTACKVVVSYAPDNVLLQELVITIVTLSVLISTHFLIKYRSSLVETKLSTAKSTETLNLKEATEPKLVVVDIVNEGDEALASEIQKKLLEQSLFLTPNLKVGDLAKALDVPEYRISRALKQQMNAKNFNHFVNKLRIEHAQTLLLDPEKQQWPVLVVGLESGFASVGPFTRAFKQFTGVTPNQYRQQSVQPQAQHAH